MSHKSLQFVELGEVFKWGNLERCMLIEVEDMGQVYCLNLITYEARPIEQEDMTDIVTMID